MSNEAALHAYRCDIGVIVQGIGEQKWLRATVNLPCVPRIDDWVYVGESIIVVERIELRDASSDDPHIDVLAKSIRSRDQKTVDLIDECDLTEAQGWT